MEGPLSGMLDPRKRTKISGDTLCVSPVGFVYGNSASENLLSTARDIILTGRLSGINNIDILPGQPISFAHQMFTSVSTITRSGSSFYIGKAATYLSDLRAKTANIVGRTFDDFGAYFPSNRDIDDNRLKHIVEVVTRSSGRMVKWNADNITTTRVENVGNQNVHLHLHYTEPLSQALSERVDGSGGDSAIETTLPEDRFVESNLGHRISHHKEGIFSRAFNIEKQSKTNTVVKKTFKDLLGLLRDEMSDNEDSDMSGDEMQMRESEQLVTNAPSQNQQGKMQEVTRRSSPEERRFSLDQGRATEELMTSIHGEPSTSNSTPNSLGLPQDIQRLLAIVPPGYPASSLLHLATSAASSSTSNNTASSSTSNRAASRFSPSHHFQSHLLQEPHLYSPFPTTISNPFQTPDFMKMIRDTVADSLKAELAAIQTSRVVAENTAPIITGSDARCSTEIGQV